MQDFKERLNWLMVEASKEEGLRKRMSLAEFGNRISYSAGQLSRLLRGLAAPEDAEPRFWDSLERVYKCGEWVRTGEGPQPDLHATYATKDLLRESGGYRAKEGPEQLCRQHFNEFVERCEGDPARLGWTLIELRKHFPLDMWERTESKPPAKMPISSSVGERVAEELMEDAVGEVLPERPGPLRKREADERSDPKHSRPGGAVKS